MHQLFKASQKTYGILRFYKGFIFRDAYQVIDGALKDIS